MSVDLIGCYWTLAGDYRLGSDDYSPLGFVERVEAAAEAGYTGFGLKHSDLMRTIATHGLDEIGAIFRANGIRVLELECIFGWYDEPDAADRPGGLADDLIRASRALGAHHLKAAGNFSGPDPGLEVRRAAFARLARRAHNEGVRVSLEPIAFSHVATLADAQAVIGDQVELGHGLMLDVWHVNRGVATYPEIAALPAEWIVGAELDDGAQAHKPDPVADTLDRRLCGEGEFDLAGFVAAVQATGYGGPFGVEIISEEQRRRPLAEAARRSFDTARALFP